jgi:hypothetical protein
MSLRDMWIRFSFWRASRAVKREEARHGGREKMIDDMIVKAAGLRCGMTNAEALAMYAQIDTGIWPTHDSRYREFLAAMDTEEAYWRPGKVRLEHYE